jgi:hypothetical protein
MIRGKPDLALVLLRAAGADAPPRALAAGVGEALSPVIEDYRPDCIVELRNERAVLERVVVVEVQRRRDRKKLFALPVYQALARARHKVPCDVLVIAPSPPVADWLRRPVVLGSGSLFRATVVGSEELWLRREPEGAEVAFLRALAHGGTDPALVLTAARLLDRLTDSRALLYFDVILRALPDATRRVVEVLMQSEELEFESPYLRGLLARGRAEGREEGRATGREEGRATGREEGRATGRAEGLRIALRGVLASRGITLEREDEVRLAAKDDLHMLEAWIRCACVATTAREVFGEPEEPLR